MYVARGGLYITKSLHIYVITSCYMALPINIPIHILWTYGLCMQRRESWENAGEDVETKVYVIAWATIYDALVLTDMLTFPPF